MRICVYGAGAIGGWLAVRLALGGHEVSVVARGEHLAAIRRDGLTLLVGEERFNARVRASDKAADLGEQDAVLVTLKASGLDGLAQAIAPLLGPTTMVVFAQNGLPWWYGVGLAPNAPKPADLSWLDPDGSLANLNHRVIGGVIRSMSEVIAPGVIIEHTPNIVALTLGEPDDSQSPRLTALQAALEGSGVASPPTASIREVLWNKLLANLTGSVMCMLTGLTMRQMHESPLFEGRLETLRREVQAVGAAHGCMIASLPPVAKRVLSDHKPSILQDYERGRAMEIDAIVVAPLMFARVAEVATPSLDLMAALAVEKAMARGLYAPRCELPF